jgi:ribonuclease-3
LPLRFDLREKSFMTSPAAPYRLPDLASEQAFSRNVGIQFRNERLLRLALTHRSVLHDWINVENLDATMQSNERLEFLGDALLGVIVGEHLYHADPTADEGTLTRRRAAIVRAETLVLWARELKMPDYLYLGTGESVTQSARDRMLAGGFEALVGAIYLDQGRDLAERWVRGYLQRDIASILATEEQTNPKGTLQEVMQERFGTPPEYETIAAEGPDHARQFTVAVVLNDEHIGTGRGRSKREAQQAAARVALVALGVDIDTPVAPTMTPPEPFALPIQEQLTPEPMVVVAVTGVPDDAVSEQRGRAARGGIRGYRQRRIRGSGKREG